MPSATPYKQLGQVEALIALLDQSRGLAAKGDLFGTPLGARVVNAAYDLFEVDGLYDLAADIEHDLGLSNAEPDAALYAAADHYSDLARAAA